MFFLIFQLLFLLFLDAKSNVIIHTIRDRAESCVPQIHLKLRLASVPHIETSTRQLLYKSGGHRALTHVCVQIPGGGGASERRNGEERSLIETTFHEFAYGLERVGRTIHTYPREDT